MGSSSGVSRSAAFQQPANSEPARYHPIADYALIGDCHTAALVARDGSIDWYCPFRFDRAAVFCRVLDADKGGTFGVRPSAGFAASRRYVGATNVLETTFSLDGGRLVLTDFMTVRGHDQGTSEQIVRLLEAQGCDVEVEVHFKPTFDFARASARIEAAPAGFLATDGKTYLALGSGTSFQYDIQNGSLRGRISLSAGERTWVTVVPALSGENARRALGGGDVRMALSETLDYWGRWSRSCRYRGSHRPQVLRSALALKLLTYEPTGAVVAAPTTSLPEELGGVRNWDYRYTWLRDASLSLYALTTLGYHDEAFDFMNWLEKTCSSDPTRAPQIMYTIDHDTELPEFNLEHLEGYRGSRPVRVGNAASEQRQLDIFGDVLAAAYHSYTETEHRRRRAEAGAPHPSPSLWSVLSGLVSQAASRWREPDSGIWEFRGEPRQFVYSKLMCWVALDRGIRLAEEFALEAPLVHWRRVRDDIRQAILEQGFDQNRGAFTQAFGRPDLDASVLAIPRFGFLPATDPRVQSTVRVIQSSLSRDGLIERYRADDGLPGREGSFSLCSFWMVDALALGGRLDEARELFERILSYANDVGLLSEEMEPSTKELLGNFPQGFSHMALIGAAVNLAKAARHGPEEAAETEPQRARRVAAVMAELGSAE